MLDKDDKRLVNRIRKVVKGNKGISLEEIAEVLDESTDLVLIYIDNYAENIVEYEPNQFKLVEYYWLDDRSGTDYIGDRTFISKESACEYFINDELLIPESDKDVLRQGDIDLQVETAKEYSYYLKEVS